MYIEILEANGAWVVLVVVFVVDAHESGVKAGAPRPPLRCSSSRAHCMHPGKRSPSLHLTLERKRELIYFSRDDCQGRSSARALST